MAANQNQPAYTKQAQNLLSKYNDICHEIASFAAATKMHPAHVKHMQDQINNRSRVLVKQIQVEHVELDLELPAVTE